MGIPLCVLVYTKGVTHAGKNQQIILWSALHLSPPSQLPQAFTISALL